MSGERYNLSIKGCGDCPFAIMEELGIFVWTECIHPVCVVDGDVMRLSTRTLEGWCPPRRWPKPPPEKCPLRVMPTVLTFEFEEPLGD